MSDKLVKAGAEVAPVEGLARALGAKEQAIKAPAADESGYWFLGSTRVWFTRQELTVLFYTDNAMWNYTRADFDREILPNLRREPSDQLSVNAHIPTIADKPALDRLMEAFNANFPEVSEYRKAVSKATGIAPGYFDAVDFFSVNFEEMELRTFAANLQTIPRIGASWRALAQRLTDEWLLKFRGEGNEFPNDYAPAVETAIEWMQYNDVPPTAETSISDCGCIWALQTTFRYGSGDVIVRPCPKHSSPFTVTGRTRT